MNILLKSTIYFLMVSCIFAQEQSRVNNFEAVTKVLLSSEKVLPIEKNSSIEVITNKPIDVIGSADNQKVIETKTINLNTELSISKKFSLLAGMEKFSLDGNGFNADLDYSNSLGAKAEFSLIPGDQPWIPWASLLIKNTFYNNLNGLRPNKVNHNVAEVTFGIDYKWNQFKIAPVFQYQKIFSQKTSPNTLEVKRDAALVGGRFVYSSEINPYLSADMYGQFLLKLIAAPSNYSDGQIDSIEKINSGFTFNIKTMNENYYLLGLEFERQKTNFERTTLRSTNNESETKMSLMLLVGLRYD